MIKPIATALGQSLEMVQKCWAAEENCKKTKFLQMIKHGALRDQYLTIIG